MGDSSLVITYKSKRYDLTKFQHKHPGGKNTLKGLNNADIKQRFENAPPHSNAAFYLMKEYEIQHINERNNNGNLKNGIDENLRHEIKENGTKHISKNGKITTNDININKKQHKTDESMEYLVDWSKPMIPQLGSITKEYSEWVNKPVDRPLILLGPPFLDFLSKTPWWAVPLFWVPSILYITKIGLQEAHASGYSHSYLSFIGGIALWSILEYLLHRFVFHLDTSNAGAFICKFHFLFHGLHHKVPFDRYRLLSPQLSATIIATIFYQPLRLICSCPKLVFAGMLLGYLCYEMTHYYAHHGSPTFSYMYNAKRYHLQHHFVRHDQGFGVTSSFWDKIFGTKLFIRKLKYMLKW